MAKKIGLALSGGGARGFAHIGVLQVLVENDIPIDVIAGTSAGSIVGGAFASGMHPDQIASMAERVRWGNLMRPSLSPLGLMSNPPMGKFIEREFPARRFEDLRIPFGAVAYDLSRGQELVIQQTGQLAPAILASCCVPGVFAPLRTPDGRLLVDGGVVSPVPTLPARAMGADIVIAVDLIGCGSSFRKVPGTALGVVLHSTMALLKTTALVQTAKADIAIVPEIAHLRPDQIDKRWEFVDCGRRAAAASIDEIKKLIAGRGGASAHLMA